MAHVSKPDKNSREYQEQQISNGRGSVLVILLFSVFNLALLLLDTGRYFLFSTSVPYYLTWFGKILDNGTDDGSGAIIGAYTITALVISLVILAVYLAVWLLSKKRHGWLTAGAVLFTLDTVALVVFAFCLLDNPASCLYDIVIHVIAVWQLFHASHAARKLKSLPDTAPAAEGYQGTTPDLDA